MAATTTYQTSGNQRSLADPDQIKAPAPGDDVTGQIDDEDDEDFDDEEDDEVDLDDDE